MNNKIESVSIKSVNDINRVIALYFKRPTVSGVSKLETDIVWTGDKTKYKTTVSAEVEDVDVRATIIRELTVIREQKKVFDDLAIALEDDEYAPALPRIDSNKLRSPIDSFIKNRMGAIREGVDLVWYLNDKKYIFNPFTTELKEENASN